MADDAGTQRTPLYDRHVAAGARLVEFAGWLMPVRYGSATEEHHAVRRAAGLFDVSHMGEIVVEGPEAVDFLQRLTPNNVAKLAVGQAHYSGLLTDEGTYVDDLLVYRLAEDRFLLVVNAANAATDLEWIRARHAGADCAVEDRSADYALLALQGPRAAEILARHTGAELDRIAYYHFVEDRVAGAPCIVSRTGYTGEEGFELYLPPAAAPGVWDALVESGRGDGLLPAGLAARDSLRLEAGMALYGHEIDRDTTPYEAGLGWTVKLKKGDFVGRDALREQKRDGVPRRLAGFELVDRGVARQDQPVFWRGAEIGPVRSGSWSPTLERAIGTVYVPADLDPGSDGLEIEVRGRRLEARVVELPFYRRS